MRLFVVGDIHGCYNELIRLLDKTDNMIEEGDQYVFLGDYIDRGPNSKQVIDLLIARSKDHPNEHIFIKGNHEDMLINKYPGFFMNGGYDTIKSYGCSDTESYRFWDEYVPSSHKNFLEDLRTYYKVGRTVCVHAGLDPEKELEEQYEQTMIWSRQTVGYDGFYKGDLFVVYGHTPVEKKIDRQNQLGIDTGCVFGNKLTCAIIAPEEGISLGSVDIKSEFKWR